jgi:hypothetical protein
MADTGGVYRRRSWRAGGVVAGRARYIDYLVSLLGVMSVQPLLLIETPALAESGERSASANSSVVRILMCTLFIIFIAIDGCATRACKAV